MTVREPLPTKDAGQTAREVVSAFATIELNEGWQCGGTPLKGTTSPPPCVGRVGNNDIIGSLLDTARNAMTRDAVTGSDCI
jgi:hypothetical protein